MERGTAEMEKPQRREPGESFLSLFEERKPVMGMLHLKGSDPESVVNQAWQEAKVMTKNGVDAVIVENYFGGKEDVENVLRSFQESGAEFLYGVNVLDDDQENFRIAKKYGAVFLQLDSVSGHLTPEEDSAFARFVQTCRSQYDGYVIGGVRFKYQPYKSGRSLFEDLHMGMDRCDAIAVTGEGTGMLTPVEKLAEFRSIVGEFPLIVAAGVIPSSCPKQLAIADGVIVGSYLKDTYQDQGDVDGDHVKEFMDAVKRCR